MITDIDDGKGVVKLYWRDIRLQVKKVNPEFAKIVDELSPDKKFPIYKAYYPYGDVIADTKDFFLPKRDGGHYKISDKNTPKEIAQQLAYGQYSIPTGMVLNKNIEYYVDLENDSLSIPWDFLSPGKIFPFSRLLREKNKTAYNLNGVLMLTSGSRSVSMLPNIGCAINHANLQRDFNVQLPPPKSLYDHWGIFKEITQNKEANCDWASCLMYLSEPWINKIHNDKGWSTLKTYLLEIAWDTTEFQRNRAHYDIAFSIVQKNRNLKPNPYLADTVRHLISSALGKTPAYAPAIDNQSVPIETLQRAFTEAYNLKKYIPTIMQPVKFNFEKDKYPVYYSLQNPATHAFSPKSRETFSTSLEMRELNHLAKIFFEELTREDNVMFHGTILSKVANNINLNYFHNKADRHNIIQSSKEIIKLDDRFNFIVPGIHLKKAVFSSDAKFFRGCISISNKHHTEPRE